MLGLASCQTDVVDGVKVDANGEAPVTLQVGLPQDAATRANSAYGAIDNEVSMADYDIRFILAVYDENGVLAKGPMVKHGDEDEASFSFRLVPGRKYHFVAWADFVGNDSDADLHYDTSLFPVVSLKGEQKLNDESRDAYTQVVTVDKFTGASSIPTMVLKRPFAKLRVIATDMNQLYSDLKSVKVDYTSNIYTSFNALSSDVVENSKSDLSPKTVTYPDKYNGYVYGAPANGEMTLFADYIFGGEDDRVMFTLDVTDATEFTIPQVVFNTNIPVERNYLTTIKGNVLTDANNITVTIEDNFDGENSVNRDSNDVEKALKQNHKNIYVELTDDVALNGNGVKWGGEDTELIVIDGKKLATNAATGASTGNHTLTFNTTYRLHIETVNPDAKVILRNLNVTTNKESGTWDIYDIQFNCNVDIENVNFQKAIAFVKDGQSVSIKDVTINETHDYYAMWISAVGQTINIENLVVNSEGRGIKIDEEYLDASEVAKVTLNINNAKFTTKKKAAILVKSVAGADITLSNIDITGVAADAEFAVWVDEDSKAYADKVSVTGAYVKVEGAKSAVVSTTADLKSALESGMDVVAVAKGEYTFPSSSVKAGQTIVCEEGTVFTGKSNLNINGATVIGATFQSESNGLVAYYSTINGTYKDCVFNGDLKFSEAGDTVVFENCVFNGPDYALHFDTAVANSHVILKGCEVNSQWRVAIGAAVSMFEAIDTKFNVAGFINLWGKAKFTNCAFNKPSYWICCMDTTEFTNCTCEGRALVANDIRIEDTVITINNELFTSSNEGLKFALENNASVVNLVAGNYELSGLNFVANNVTLKGVDKANVVLNLEKSIYLQDKSVTLENLTYNLNAGKGYTEQAFAFVHHATAFNLKNCNVNRLRLNVYEANIEDCTFTLNTSSGFDGYCIYYYGNDNSTVNVKNSTFATAGKGICIYSEHAKAYNLNVDKCSFTSSDSATDKAAIQMHTELGIYGNVKITETTATGFANINGGLWNELNNNTKVATDKFDIWVDGTQVH